MSIDSGVDAAAGKGMLLPCGVINEGIPRGLVPQAGA